MNIKKILDKQNNMSFRAVVFMVCQVVTQGVGVILAPILTRLLSTADYGITSVYSTTVSIAGVIVGLQTHASLNNAIITYDESEKDKYNSSVLFLAFLSFISFFAITLIFNKPLSQLLGLDKILLYLLIPYAFSTFCVTFLSAYLRIQKKAFQFAALTIGLSIVSSVLSIGFIINMTSNRYMGKIWGMAIPYLLLGTIILTVFMVKGKTFYNKDYWKFCMPLSVPLIFHGLSGMILAQSDRVMLSRISGESFAGVYSFCYTMAIPINAVWFSLNNSWIPQYYEHMKSNDYVTLKKHVSGYNFTFTMLTIGFILVCPETVKFLAPQSYWTGMPVIPMVVLAYYFTFLYGFPSNHEFYHRKTVYVSISSACAAGLNIVLNLILIPKFNMMGAAVATLVSHIMLFLVHEIVARFIVKEYSYLGLKFYLKGLSPVVAAVVLTYALMNIWVIRWCLGAVVGSLILVRVFRNRSIF